MHLTGELQIDDLPSDCIEDCGRGVHGAAGFWREALSLTVDREQAVAHLYRLHDGASQASAMTDDEIAETILMIACGEFYRFQKSERGERHSGAYGRDVFCL